MCISICFSGGLEWESIRAGDITWPEGFSDHMCGIVRSLLHPEPDERPSAEEVYTHVMDLVALEAEQKQHEKDLYFDNLKIQNENNLNEMERLKKRIEVLEHENRMKDLRLRAENEEDALHNNHFPHGHNTHAHHYWS